MYLAKIKGHSEIVAMFENFMYGSAVTIYHDVFSFSIFRFLQNKIQILLIFLFFFCMPSNR